MVLSFYKTSGDITTQFVGIFQDPTMLVGIGLALVGAVLMALGALYQHHGVAKVKSIAEGNPGEGFRVRQFGALIRRPSWLLGTVLLGAAICCQLVALAFAPLIIVQPMGTLSVVVTALLNARMSGNRPTAHAVRAIAMCIAGIVIFLGVAVFFATERPFRQMQLIVVLILLAGIMLVLVVLWLLRFRHHPSALFYIVAAGMLYGFVATLAKVVIVGLQTSDITFLWVLCLVSLVIAVVVGAYFVQVAYSVGSPDLVVAGLTVIDPIVAVTIGLVVLREAESAGILALSVFAAAGALASYGVVSLSRSHSKATDSKITVSGDTR